MGFRVSDVKSALASDGRRLIECGIVAECLLCLVLDGDGSGGRTGSRTGNAAAVDDDDESSVDSQGNRGYCD